MIILDRFEGKVAVLEEEGNFFHVSIDKVSPFAKEGDVLILKEGMYIPDKFGTNKRKKKIEEKFNELWE